MPSAPLIGVYGATGFSGQLVLHELLRRGLGVVAAARDGQKLARVIALQSQKVMAKTAAATKDELACAFDRCDVVIHCAGPFAKTNKAMMEAACSAHFDVVMLCDELEATRHILAAQREFLAHGVTVVCAAGFATTVAELTAYLATRKIQDVQGLRVYAGNSAAIPSLGTLASYLSEVDQGILVVRNGRCEVADPSARPHTIRLPEPLGERAAVLAPMTEALALHSIYHAPSIETYFAGLPQKAASMRHATVFSRDREVLERLRVLRQNSASSGPSEAERKGMHFAMRVVACNRAQQQSCVTMAGVDPYGLTAALAVEAALAAKKPGAFFASQVLDKVKALALLAHLGVRWERVENCSEPI